MKSEHEKKIIEVKTKFRERENKFKSELEKKVSCL